MAGRFSSDDSWPIAVKKGAGFAVRPLVTRPLFKNYRTRLNTARLPAQTLWLPSTKTPTVLPPNHFPVDVSPTTLPCLPCFSSVPYTHQFTWSFQRGLSSCNGILFQNWTLAKTIPVAVQPVPFTSHLLFFFPCFLSTTKTKLWRYPVDETIGGIVEKPQRIVLGRHGR